MRARESARGAAGRRERNLPLIGMCTRGRITYTRSSNNRYSEYPDSSCFISFAAYTPGERRRLIEVYP